MSEAKVIPIDCEKRIREKLISATGTILAREGFERMDEDLVAREAGVGMGNIRRCFGGLEGLISAFGQSEVFWPSSRELMRETRRDFAELSAEQQVAAFYKSLLSALRRRPETMDILAWEALERNDYSRRLEEIRVRISLEYFENMQGDIPEEADVSAIVAILAGAVQFLAVRSRRSAHFGGIDLRSGRGWRRIEAAIDALLTGSFTASAGNGGVAGFFSGQTPRGF
jgi:AcrR family transcriptional regulator